MRERVFKNDHARRMKMPCIVESSLAARLAGAAQRRGRCEVTFSESVKAHKYHRSWCKTQESKFGRNVQASSGPKGAGVESRLVRSVENRSRPSHHMGYT